MTKAVFIEMTHPKNETFYIMAGKLIEAKPVIDRFKKHGWSFSLDSDNGRNRTIFWVDANNNIARHADIINLINGAHRINETVVWEDSETQRLKHRI